MDESKSGKGGGKPGRAERLAAALRANLHRRKAQARARREAGAVAPGNPRNGPEEAIKCGEDR